LEPVGPGLGKARAAVPAGPTWHLWGAQRPGCDSVSRGMKRARDRIQRALENYPRGFRRSEMWAENEIQI